MYKLFDTPYEMGKSKVWKKFKHERETIDAIVVGEEYGKLGSKFEHEKVVFRLGVIGSGGSIVELCSVLVGSVDIAKTITLNSVIEIKYYQI